MCNKSKYKKGEENCIKVHHNQLSTKPAMNTKSYKHPMGKHRYQSIKTGMTKGSLSETLESW